MNLLRAIYRIALTILTLCCLTASAPAQTPWTGTWSTSPMSGSISTAFNNMTLRQIAHTSISGTSARVQISNAFGTQPLTISDVHLAQATSPSSTSTVAGTDHAVTFGGSSSVTIPAGGKAVSDTVAMAIGAQADIAVSFYFPTASMTSNVTYHQFGMASSWWASGDVSSNASFSPIGQSNSYYFLANLDVQNAAAIGSVVCLGASITDGYASTFGGNKRWPNDLSARINSASMTVGVLNQGIAGNKLLSDGSGPSAQNRFQRDVVQQPNVKWVIFSDDPINDLTSNNPPPTAAQLESAVSNLITQAHQAGLKIYLSTLTPYSKYSGWTQAQETIREQVIAWEKGGTTGADGIVDQDAATHDPNAPTAFLPAYDSGDGLHPNDAGLQAIANTVNLNFFASTVTEAPYGGTPAAIPGTVQAENYDTGGQGVGYNATIGNGTANTYRADGIDLETTADTGGGYDVGWSTSGQWFRYTVNAVAGTYTATFRVANGTAGNATFTLQNASGAILAAITVPPTGGWQTWTNATASVTLPAGQQVLTIAQTGGGYNLNSMSFASSEAPFGGTPSAIPGTIQAENYDTGGQGTAYNATAGNGTANTAYRADGIDLETCADTGTGYDLGWTGGGQWFRYIVNVATAGTYTVNFRIATPGAVTDAFHLSNSSGTNLSGNVNLPATGGWQTWSTVTANVTLPAGQQTLTVNEDNGGWNLNWMRF